MGVGESVEETPPDFFNGLLTNDIKLNDPICKAIFSSRLLTHTSLSNNILTRVARTKPNNVRVLAYQSVFSINRISQIQYQTEIPQSLLISCYNSFLVLQRFCSSVVSKWHTWPSPSTMSNSIPSVLFDSAVTILGHPQIRDAPDSTLQGHVRLEIFSTMLMFLLSPNQEIYENYPNHHYYALDMTNPMPIINTVINVRKHSPSFARIVLILCSTGLGFCQSWVEMLSDFQFSSIFPIFDPLLTPPTESQLSLSNSQSPGIYLELFALFYQILLLPYDVVESLPKGRQFVVSVLLPLQQFNEKNSLTYFHSLALSTLVLLTSDPALSASLNEPFTGTFACKSSVHRGTYADLLVEIITNTTGSDLSRTAPLLPAVACIIHNISAHVNSFSFFTSNRLFIFLNQLIESRDRQAPKLVQIVIDGINQIISEQFEHNTTILMFVVRNQNTFKMLRQKGLDVKYILAFISAFKQKVKQNGIVKLGTDIAEQILKSLNPKQFMDGYEPPGPRGHVFTGEMAGLWADWMRTLAMRGDFKGDFA
ncbi:hypothetical protein TVAG_172030 [Trichomonas vaginalis G3]|uniref:Dymeclin n=1 Tax=Trichomonas vaginalis (strain ATCC PRA-98 / G3) TaxID=412133 RepID=A2DEV4_TRIV3|nr:HID1 family [Trichomonas vaginalis G3]EAY20946.1 hypothetical protein TVAG_172030 [Trichomonas vaginalis G3]KAI5519105.1 HID1 family [Trichomonas vaginalis G3]|eukprot:XP_001581932.1 hypothetical protein [Trichomonas vaginalis G3]